MSDNEKLIEQAILREEYGDRIEREKCEWEALLRGHPPVPEQKRSFMKIKR
jgi:hypothetical protein